MRKSKLSFTTLQLQVLFLCRVMLMFPTGFTCALHPGWHPFHILVVILIDPRLGIVDLVEKLATGSWKEVKGLGRGLCPSVSCESGG